MDYDDRLEDDGRIWRRCWNCDEGFVGHECGEDVCVCPDPQENVPCDVCEGEGGWYLESKGEDSR
jgi:hypothetical protein